MKRIAVNLILALVLSISISSNGYTKEVDVHVTWDSDLRNIENGAPIQDWTDYKLCIGNEFIDDRTWLGSIYSVAFYDRMLRGDEIEKNFNAGYDGNDRVSDNLISYYNFKTGSGTQVFDQTDNPLNLTIDPPSAVTWIASGGVSINSSARISSAGVASKIIDAVKASNEITLEAWIKPFNLTQDGPARIVSISQDSSARNITLGQAAESYKVRCRTSATTIQGTPSLDTVGGVVTQLTHIVYAIDSRGAASIYINGVAAASQHTIPSTYTAQDDEGNDVEYNYVFWQNLKFFERGENEEYDYDNPVAILPQVYDANGYSNPKILTIKSEYEDSAVSTNYFVVRSYHGEGEDEIHSEDSEEVSLEMDLTIPVKPTLMPPTNIYTAQ